MKKLQLTLTLTVNYDLQGADPAALKDMLMGVANHAFAEGMITGDTEAEIEKWKASVEGGGFLLSRSLGSVRPDYSDAQDPSTVALWLSNLPADARVCIDDDGLRLQVIGNEDVYLEVGGHEPEKVPLSISDFVDRLGHLGADSIIPEVAYRVLCQEMDGDPIDEDRQCRLELSDRPAFRQGMNDYADGQQKDRQWVTFDNGNCYYTADDIKKTVAALDGDDAVYELEPELKRIIDFWL